MKHENILDQQVETFDGWLCPNWKCGRIEKHLFECRGCGTGAVKIEAFRCANCGLTSDRPNLWKNTTARQEADPDWGNGTLAQLGNLCRPRWRHDVSRVKNTREMEKET